MRSRSNMKITAVFALMATVAGAQAREQVELPWRLADYPTGGRTMVGMVAGTLIGQGDLVESTCNALKPGNVQQIASGVAGIGKSIAQSESGNASLIVENLPRCCETLTSFDVDTRITLGAAIALETRSLGESDVRAAQEIEAVVGICEDEILDRSYELARGQDNLGQLIAQEGASESNPALRSPTVRLGTSGGLASPN